MRIFFTLTAILLAVLSVHILPQAPLAETEDKVLASDVQAQLKEADKNFYFDGKAIHPNCIRRFNILLVDSPPPIVRSVDVAACASSNQNNMPIKISDEGYVTYEYDIEEGGERILRV